MAAKQTSPAHMLARTPVERIVVSWICKLVFSLSFFLWLGLGIGIHVLGAMGINKAARSTLSGGGRESGIPGALVPSDVTAKTTR